MDIHKPTLLVDQDRCLKNIEQMFLKCQKSKVRFRPHFKTHHSIEIGHWFKSFGVNAITVSSFEMAEYFSNDWTDITVAIPVNLRAIDVINRMAKRITLNVVLEDERIAHALNDQLTDAVGVFIKIDTGYERTGISSNNWLEINRLLLKLDSCNRLKIKGLLAHAGHTYGARSKQEIRTIGQECIAKLNELKEKLDPEFSKLELSVGDTPFCSVAESFEGADEIRPGNFIFYDVMQQQIGSNTMDQIAVCLAAPILAIHPDRRTMVVHGGGIHLSKDRIIEENGETSFGKVVSLTKNGWSVPLDGFNVKSLSQEHGIIEWEKDVSHEFEVGGLIGVLPIHSCMAANLHGHYLSTKGERIEKFRID